MDAPEAAAAGGCAGDGDAPEPAVDTLDRLEMLEKLDKLDKLDNAPCRLDHDSVAGKAGCGPEEVVVEGGSPTASVPPSDGDRDRCVLLGEGSSGTGNWEPIPGLSHCVVFVSRLW